MHLEYFQLVDRVLSLDVERRVIRSASEVPEANTIFEGHFPTYPLLPGVLLIECMAQTTGWLASALCGFSGLPILAGVKEGKFRSSALPGDHLEFEGKIVHEGSGFMIGEASGWRKDTPICDARLTFRIIPYPRPELRHAVMAWAERLQVPVKELVR